jgi:hypothetical protein
MRARSGLLGDLGPAAPFEDWKLAPVDDIMAADVVEVLISSQHGQLDLVGQAGDLLDTIVIGQAGWASG